LSDAHIVILLRIMKTLHERGKERDRETDRDRQTERQSERQTEIDGERERHLKPTATVFIVAHDSAA